MIFGSVTIDVINVIKLPFFRYLLYLWEQKKKKDKLDYMLKKIYFNVFTFFFY